MTSANGDRCSECGIYISDGWRTSDCMTCANRLLPFIDHSHEGEEPVWSTTLIESYSRKPVKYQIVSSRYSSELSKKVNSFLDKGWELWGSPVASENEYGQVVVRQAVVRYEEGD